MVRDIDVSLLRAFIAVVETGSMTSAASVLSLTQAAVSLQIKRLETLFDTSLFDRSQKKIILTATGERLEAHARRMIALNDEVWNAIVTPEFEGEVTLGVPHDIVMTYIPPILRAFKRQWPNIKVTLLCESTQNLLNAVETGDADLTITTEPFARDDVLTADALVWAGMKGGNAYRERPFPISLGAETCAFRPHALDALSKAGMDWKIIFQKGFSEGASAAVEADMAVQALLGQCVPKQFEILGEQHGLPPLPTFYINMVKHDSANRTLVDELAAAIRKGFSSRMQMVA